jgi:hypothetical protein
VVVVVTRFLERRGGVARGSAASGDDGLLAPLRNRTIPVNQKVRQRVGRKMMQERGRGDASLHGNR